MDNRCKISGFELGSKETLAEKMCLNCKNSITDEEGALRCTCEAVKNIHRQKLIDSLPEGYEIESIVFKPVLLKKPTGKCPNYDVNMEIVENTLAEMRNYFLQDNK